MASNVSWDPTVPSGTSSIAQGDDDIRSFKSFMEAAWEDEHYFTDGSTTSAGEHKVGSARAYQAASSAMSNPRVGAIFHSTTDNNLYVASGSTYSAIIGKAVNSVNTWTVRQAFNAGISVGGGLLAAIDTYEEALSQLVMEPSAWTIVSVDVEVALDRRVLSYGIAAPASAALIHSLTHNSDDDLMTLTLKNESDSTFTISAQTLYISALSFV
jgi:hypothetical protein